MLAHLLTSWFAEYFKTIVEIYCSDKKKKDSFQILLLTDKAPGHSRALMEVHNKTKMLLSWLLIQHPFYTPKIKHNFDFQVLLLKKYIL